MLKLLGTENEKKITRVKEKYVSLFNFSNLWFMIIDRNLYHIVQHYWVQKVYFVEQHKNVHLSITFGAWMFIRQPPTHVSTISYDREVERRSGNCRKTC